jgi:hypothetical protein
LNHRSLASGAFQFLSHRCLLRSHVERPDVGDYFTAKELAPDHVKWWQSATKENDPMSRCRTMLGAMVLLIPMLAVSQEREIPNRGINSSAGLPEAAHETYINYNRAYQAGNVTVQREGEEILIPSNYWSDPIKALNPLKVYMHRVNIVVVLRLRDNIEEGKYISIPISSFLPMNGVDGFEYTQKLWHGNVYQFYGVLDYRRVRVNSGNTNDKN